MDTGPAPLPGQRQPGLHALAQELHVLAVLVAQPGDEGGQTRIPVDVPAGSVPALERGDGVLLGHVDGPPMLADAEQALEGQIGLGRVGQGQHRHHQVPGLRATGLEGVIPEDGAENAGGLEEREQREHEHLAEGVETQP